MYPPYGRRLDGPRGVDSGSLVGRRTATFTFLLLCAALTAQGCGKLEQTRPPPPTELGIPEARPEIGELDPERAPEELAESVHAGIDCSECHAVPEGAEEGELGRANCAQCHEEEAQAYEETIHARANKENEPESPAADCADCHGAHDTLAVEDPDSRVHPRRIPATCGTCHANPELAEKLGIENPEAGSHYYESIHGRGLVAQGLLVAPGCVDCHGKAHQILEAKHPESTVHPQNVIETCGECHAGPKESYLAGIHGEAFREGRVLEHEELGDEHEAPTCQSCHTAHDIAPAGVDFRLASDRVCGECHEDMFERYMETYHGRAHALGHVGVAACFDCHGWHAILPSDDPESTLSEQNILETCQQCHQNASANFTQFMAHADHTDEESYPSLYWAFVLMTGLLLGTFGFFGLHTLMWLARLWVEKARDPEGFKRAKAEARAEKGARLYNRFRPIDRFVHFLLIVSFMLLVMTGMPIKFHTAPWAEVFFDIIGGPAVAAAVHRFAAVITLVYFALHIGSMVVLLRRNRRFYVNDDGKASFRRMLRVIFGPDSPMPRWQDAKDVVNHMKWFVGAGPRPKFDRFTYWEKFDYLAVFWGVTMIGMSGLILWFPAFFTRFLPGWTINIAHIIHSDEALLAAGFIFMFHFFNSHLRPGKWPMDPVMFSGKITEAELKHERPAQYERLAAEGRLQEEETHLGDWPKWKVFTNPFGGAAIILGLALAAAIFYAIFG